MSSRPNPAEMRIICLGFGRTGTLSLATALDKLGFGPCYHPLKIVKQTSDENDLFASWAKINDENWSPADLDDLLRGYCSIMDFIAAINAEKLYQAYPDAKYILNVRDPEAWERSLNATILTWYQALKAKLDRTKPEQSFLDGLERDVVKRYRLDTHPKEEMAAHNERMKKLVPPEKLLVYEIGEGWDRLVEFLGVPKPDEPFPHENPSQTFEGKSGEAFERK
ncbi:hypothetical protein M422DRAFT_272735 [Sphaerobolus stellatus SS14]|uniref:Protein-tyrosine sulfotransferase n=1 Tax=Sphaerobolus stellatus (strain SS14) TaxID=990650 RepID=A0A0C9UAU3_SPHS4|nr:hypothetical protein M422DRAFT_272735 [Sphaerobolus stellatus SS14]